MESFSDFIGKAVEELLNRCDQLEAIDKQAVMQEGQSEQIDDIVLQRLSDIARNRQSKRMQFFQSHEGTLLRY